MDEDCIIYTRLIIDDSDKVSNDFESNHEVGGKISVKKSVNYQIPILVQKKIKGFYS